MLSYRPVRCIGRAIDVHDLVVWITVSLRSRSVFLSANWCIKFHRVVRNAGNQTCFEDLKILATIVPLTASDWSAGAASRCQIGSLMAILGSGAAQAARFYMSETQCIRSARAQSPLFCIYQPPNASHGLTRTLWPKHGKKVAQRTGRLAPLR